MTALTRRRGIALTMAMFLAVLVLAITLTLVTMVQRDNAFAARTAMEMRAYDLARGGLDYYRLHGTSGGGTFTVAVPGTNDGFTVTADATANVTSTGTVVRGQTTYTRTLVVQSGQWQNVLDQGGSN